MNEQDIQLPVIKFLLLQYQSGANQVSMSEGTLKEAVAPVPYLSVEQKFWSFIASTDNHLSALHISTPLPSKIL